MSILEWYVWLYHQWCNYEIFRGFGFLNIIPVHPVIPTYRQVSNDPTNENYYNMADINVVNSDPTTSVYLLKWELKMWHEAKLGDEGGCSTLVLF